MKAIRLRLICLPASLRVTADEPAIEFDFRTLDPERRRGPFQVKAGGDT